jgi:hypothetical protein
MRTLAHWIQKPSCTLQEVTANRSEHDEDTGFARVRFLPGRELLTDEKASCPFPNSSLRFSPMWPGRSVKFSGEVVSPGLHVTPGSRFGSAGRILLLLAPSGLPRQRLSPGSFLARPEFASIKEAAPFQVALQLGTIFQQRLRREMFSSSFPLPECLRGSKDVSPSCRCSWLCPYTGHPSSLFGLTVPYIWFDCGRGWRVAKFYFGTS